MNLNIWNPLPLVRSLVQFSYYSYSFTIFHEKPWMKAFNLQMKKSFKKKDWRICLLDTINFTNSTLTKKSKANSCLLRYWLLLQNCKKSCHFRAIWRKTFLPLSRVRTSLPFLCEVTWYHFTAVKWYHITSPVSFLVTASSHWYLHIICNKIYILENRVQD